MNSCLLIKSPLGMVHGYSCLLLFQITTHKKCDQYCSIWNIHTKCHHQSQKNMTKLLVPKSGWVWKNLGGWCCGSCQALLINLIWVTCLMPILILVLQNLIYASNVQGTSKHTVENDRKFQIAECWLIVSWKSKWFLCPASGEAQRKLYFVQNIFYIYIKHIYSIV